MKIDPDTLEKEILREWEDSEIRSEFLDNFDTFRAFKMAEAKGLVKYELFKNGLTVDEICKVLSKPPHSTSLQVRSLANRVRSQRGGKARSPTKTRGKEIFFAALNSGEKPPNAGELCKLLDAEGFETKLSAVKNWPAEFKKEYHSR